MEDFGFYLVMTNPKVGYERCCEAAVKAGVKMVQLRMKDVSRADLLQMAKRLVGITYNDLILTFIFSMNSSCLLL